MSERVMIATMVTKPGKRDELIEVFAKMFPVAAAEEGTQLYTLIKGDEADTLYFFEQYVDQAAMDKHMGGEVLQSLHKVFGEYLASGAAVTGTVVNKL